MKDKKLPTGGLLAIFLFFYGVFRFLVEFVREPDAHLGFVLAPFTMGQVLTFFMIIAGIALFAYRWNSEKTIGVIG
jgi:phosphatidylglycerol:prolipoprotein diacylglycerol transferase